MNTRLKKLFLIITAFLLIVWGNYEENFLFKAIAASPLSGNVSLTLKQGLWKSSQTGISYQDITLDLVCEQSRCEEEVWGFAPQFNQTDHQGKVTVTGSKNAWHLQVDLSISRDPWLPLSGKAVYTIDIKTQENQIIGTYSGTFQNQSVIGEVKGSITPHYPTSISNYRPLEPQEHPRLIFRRDQIPDLQRKAKTKYGKAILAQLNHTLAQPVDYQGYVPNGGYHAVGYCLLFTLNQDRQAAKTAWQVVENSINQPAPRLFEQSPIVAGVALAYDLCYEAWTQEQINTVTLWLAEQAKILIEGEAGRGWNPNAWSNWSARARGAAGLALLALFEFDADTLKGAVTPTKWGQELVTERLEIVPPRLAGEGVRGRGLHILGSKVKPLPLNKEEITTLLKIAERNIIRFLDMGIGDHGFGSEGDHYTTEPLILTVIPFLQAYQNVMGKDLVKGKSAEWFLPHYLTRGVLREGTLSVPTYGRHRRYAGGSLFALGLGLVPENKLPAVMWGFNRYWGLPGDKTFGITSPYQAAYLLIGYPNNLSDKNPARILSRVLVDEQKGFYVFRNRWRDQDDFVASIYLKREALPGSWSFPDAGSFRISGLGENWAVAGPSNQKRESENVVLTAEEEDPITQPIFFQSFKQGSGVVSLEGKNWMRSFAVDYSKKLGVPAVFAIVDKFSNSQGENTWIMHTEGKVSLARQEFIIEGSSGATLQGKFITPENVELSFEAKEKGGKLLAKGGDRFFVVMTVQFGKPPKIKLSGKGLGSVVKVGNQTIHFKDNNIIFN